MIKFLLDKPGTGKTKKMIEMANNDALKVNGQVVYVDLDNRHMYDLHTNIRLISVRDFELKNFESFYGFLCGLLGENYDIQKIYVDGLKRLIPNLDKSLDEVESCVNDLSHRFGIDIIMSASLENDTPIDFEKKLLMEA
ncbi:MAG: hypothetical protein N4A54_08950 [Peptostreptococcaceae bacterium]|jgi:hypothetical protein|nr:hypothetical protein [Peptostreptococcaceae bacterium]